MAANFSIRVDICVGILADLPPGPPPISTGPVELLQLFDAVSVTELVSGSNNSE
jgi:hypothetical protein